VLAADRLFANVSSLQQNVTGTLVCAVAECKSVQNGGGNACGRSVALFEEY